MRTARLLSALLLGATLLGGCGTTGASAPPTTAATLVDIGAGLQGTADLSAEVVVEDLEHVAGLAYDDDGRLWAATAASDDQGDDAVYLVVDGTATAVIVDLHSPIGLLWFDGELYVASYGRVDAYGSFDGTAFATHRAVLELPDGVGISNGLVLDPDGRLVLGVSAPCDACDPDTDLAAAIVSFLPDGTDLRVDVAGVRAPTGLVYVPGTDELLVTMNQRDDLDDATPADWLALVEPGQDWGFPDCYGQDDEPACANVPTALADLDDHAGASGVAVVSDLGSPADTVAVVAEWATGTVVAVPLTDDGTAAAGTMQTLITGMTNPMPVLADPAGGVLVGDWSTGTVYRIM